MATDKIRALLDVIDVSEAGQVAEVESLEATIERLQSQLLTAIQIKNASAPPGLLLSIRELAEAQDMEIPEWVFEQLRITIDEKAGRVGMIPVEAEICDKFRAIAKGRGVSLEYVTAKEGFTNFILDGFDNYRL